MLHTKWVLLVYKSEALRAAYAACALCFEGRSGHACFGDRGCPVVQVNDVGRRLTAILDLGGAADREHDEMAAERAVPGVERQAGHAGRAVFVRATFTMPTESTPRSCKLHRARGYGHAWRPALPPPAEAGGLQRRRLG